MGFHQDLDKIIVGVADMKIGQSPEVIETTLGSCVAVCLYAAARQVGGMVHIMMPHADENSSKAQGKKAKYANTAVPELVRQLTSRYGIDSHHFVAKIFGGGKILKDCTLNIGELNEKAVREQLKNFGIRIMASKTGGEKGCRVTFFLETGIVLCQKFGEAVEEL
ncbi:MAG TPA: chemotaxis protein CheD [Candidatus Omnitrophota bacterium]|nr:chemotaxis protein CheD [Candidatus Omnitrophota bacterium]HPB68707.1 chemotaxis protein CheD [Candidatus Omnitrophota bacterium]HQO58899.1 chemotaxis protein CheD [Candidatus Omnitrophota bacterium]HQP12849.1 chemotaxis protein CheD [Candidatus Omnitrophota bacterium]